MPKPLDLTVFDPKQDFHYHSHICRCSVVFYHQSGFRTSEFRLDKDCTDHCWRDQVSARDVLQEQACEALEEAMEKYQK